MNATNEKPRGRKPVPMRMHMRQAEYIALAKRVGLEGAPSRQAMVRAVAGRIDYLESRLSKVSAVVLALSEKVHNLESQLTAGSPAKG